MPRFSPWRPDLPPPGLGSSLSGLPDGVSRSLPACGRIRFGSVSNWYSLLSSALGCCLSMVSETGGQAWYRCHCMPFLHWLPRDGRSVPVCLFCRWLLRAAIFWLRLMSAVAEQPDLSCYEALEVTPGHGIRDLSLPGLRDRVSAAVTRERSIVWRSTAWTASSRNCLTVSIM
ncbi:hypothetical protein HOE425_330821 [Hoeflea sp. EC-HK425]|nr:hypothetical protein HOE425_330821 [Hoeflea sp. EC-HK425]